MQNLDLLTKLGALGIDMALKAGGMQPIAPPPSPQPGITISSSGKIGPDWRGNPHREPGAIFLTYGQFMAIAEKLKERLLKGAIEPGSEGEIPRLVCNFALKPPKGFAEGEACGEGYQGTSQNSENMPQ